MNSVSFYGIPTVSVGITSPPEEGGYEVMIDQFEDKRIYRKLVLKDGRLVGALLVGRIERAGILSGLIRDKLPVNGFKDRLLQGPLSLLDLPIEMRRERLRLRPGPFSQESEDRPFIEG